MDKPVRKPTLASTWQAVAGTAITDQLLDWPPDMFALTEVILERSAAYRFALSPPAGESWPPATSSGWANAVGISAQLWSAWLDEMQGTLPELLIENWVILRENLELPMESIAAGRHWPVCTALLTLHAIADEACAGLGVALDTSSGEGCIYRARGRELLARTGSMARIESERLRVLPKIRTPPKGTSQRSLSRYACVSKQSVIPRWHKMPARRPGTDISSKHANLLLLPWPLRVREADFHPVENSVKVSANESFGLFEFAPRESLDLDLLRRTILGARQEVDSVDVVVLPESAIDESEIEGVEQLLERMGVIMLIAGVRQRSPEPGRLPGNWVHIGINPALEKGGFIRDSGAIRWFHIKQNKHHRWSLDERQIYQYHLGGALHPGIRWWERIEIPRRQINFVELGDEVTLVSLVCEDLAQIDDVAEIIRSVGPTVVITPVLDGPQLSSRWAARYASVLADDPGCSVLTLSSLGMVQRCRPAGRPALPIIAMWKDPVRGVREIPLEFGAHGVLLTVCSENATRRTTDGRLPIDNTTTCFDVAVHQVHAVDSVEPIVPPSDRSGHSVLEDCDLTVLTGWAEAIAEALVFAPQSAERLISAAGEGAPWRLSLNLAALSPQLADALRSMANAIRAAITIDPIDPVSAILVSCGIGPESESEIGRLSCLVMRSALEQLRTRQFPRHRFAAITDVQFGQTSTVPFEE